MQFSLYFFAGEVSTNTVVCGGKWMEKNWVRIFILLWLDEWVSRVLHFLVKVLKIGQGFELKKKKLKKTM
jgi:hypothetical protein